MLDGCGVGCLVIDFVLYEGMIKYIDVMMVLIQNQGVGKGDS